MISHKIAAAARYFVSGLSVLVFVAALISSSEGQTLSVLHTFTGGADGGTPEAGVILDAQGNVYGTTTYGGALSLGTVFKVSPLGTETVLHSFAGYPTEGANPGASLIRDAQGNLYGTSPGGPLAYGTVFEVSPAGVETVFYTFHFVKGQAYSGPSGSLIRDAQGNLYGVNQFGGPYGYGTVYRVTSSGQEKAFYTFTGKADGGFPAGALVRDAQGNLFGVMGIGNSSGFCDGAIFEISPNGAEKLLYCFTGGIDGKSPNGGLVTDAEGNLYGTTTYGGAFGNGTVFEVTPSGTETVLYNFTGGSDGDRPFAGVFRDQKGNFYGTTFWGGANSRGNVFELAADGTETSIYSFTGAADGGNPWDVVRDGKGNLYGTTYTGGSGSGTVFQVIP